MSIFICKMCGRSLKSGEHPNYCYADRMDKESSGLEEIPLENALKMGISQEFLDSDERFEFPGDVKFDPFTGQSMKVGGDTLSQYQDAIMVKAR